MKKKFTLLMMLAFLGLNIGALRAQTNWGGSGTESDPYTISNAAGLVELATKVNAGNSYSGTYFKLANDIDLSSVCGEEVGDPAEEISWTPIGYLVRPFCGVFDGSEYTIDYLYINNNSSYQGLFGRAVGAIIKNVKIGEHSSVSGSNLVGALVGSYDVNKSQAGGVIFENCVNYATVKGCQRVGGLAGSIWSQNNNNEGVGQFNACINHGTVQSVAYSGNPEETDFVGGLFGEVAILTEYKYQCQFIGCKNFGTVTNQYNYTGGIFGVIGYNSTVKQCENHGIVTGVGSTGGIMGSVYLPFDELIVESCHNYAQVNASGSGALGVGGIVGGVSLSTVDRQTQVLSSCINEGKVEASGALAVGGVIGLLNTSAQSTPGSQSYLIENCQNQSAVSGSEGVGGVLGVCGIISPSYDPDAISVEGKFMNECSNLGNISGNNYVGGICGCNHYDAYSLPSFGGKITNCENTGKVTTIASYSNAGGIIADGNKIVVENCTNSGEIEGFQFVGGICGKLKDSEVTACQNSGNVFGKQIVGGITGCLTSGTITSSFNTGDIEFNGSGAATMGGGIVGSVAADISHDDVGSTIQCCYNMGNIKSNSISESERVFLGGIVGMLKEDGSDISNCYNSGVLSSVEVSEGVAVCIGGIISYISNAALTLTNSYNVGNFVYPNATVLVLGGVVAAVEGGDITISNCFYDKQMCPVVNVFCPDADGTPRLTSAMTNGSWVPGGSAFTVSNGLYPQLTVFSASSNDLTKAASIVSVTPAFLNGVENVEGVATSPFTVGTGNSVSWSAASPFSYSEGEVSFSTAGTGTLTVSKTVSDITVSKDIVMTTVVDEYVYWPEAVTSQPEGFVINTSERTISISTPEGLAWLASVNNNYNGQEGYEGLHGYTVSLTADLDMGAYLWMPIGTQEHNFEGSFDGGNYIIKGIKLGKPEGYTGLYGSGAGYDYQGLFGRVASGSISNVIIDGENTDSPSSIYGNGYVGAVCGYALLSDSDVETMQVVNCKNYAKVYGGRYVGGICGRFENNSDKACTLSSCSNYAAIGTPENRISRGEGDVGEIAGIVGLAKNITITNCSNSARISSADGAEIGGICGEAQGTVITSCSNFGEISSTMAVGGIAGQIMFYSTITGCSNSGAVSGSGTGEVGGVESGIAIGGICGCVHGYMDGRDAPIISNCINESTGVISGSMVLGGVLGYFNQLAESSKEEQTEAENTYVLYHCYNHAPVGGEDADFVGGILGVTGSLGVNGDAAPITNELLIGDCHNDADVTGHDYVGGICSINECELLEASSIGGKVFGCTNSGNVIGNNYVGGICGEWLKSVPEFGIQGTIANCSNYGNVKVTAEVEPTIAVFQQPEAKGTIAGGIVAYTEGSTVTNCYNCGNISGGAYTAGICGCINSNENQAVAYCYNTGIIEGNETISLAGGIVGNFSIKDGYVPTNNGVQYCYNAGLVKAKGGAGGLVAYSETNVSDSYNVGYVSATKVTLTGLGVDILVSGGLIGILCEDDITPSMSNCYYDKQMCPLVDDYYTMNSGDFSSVTLHDADDNNLLTSAMTDGTWNVNADNFTAISGLYPQLKVFSGESASASDKTASLVSVTPAFLANEENVDHVTRNFTVGANDVVWSHVSGDEVMSFSGANVTVSGIGTETVAVSKEGISKYIQMTTEEAPVDPSTWVDVVTSEPEGFSTNDIDSPEDLAWFISYVNGFNGSDAHPSADGEITADIDMSAHYWVPIGFCCENITNYTKPYTGSFNGNYHNVDGIRVDWNALDNSPVINALGGGKDGNREGSDCLGMFGLVEGGAISCLNLASATIMAEPEHSMTLGGIVGEMDDGTISQCVSNATVTDNHGYGKGGIVGEASGSSIKDCMSTATLEGYGEMGGIASVAEGGSITNCYADAKFLVRKDDAKEHDDSFNSYVGGLAFGAAYCQIENCYVRLRPDSEYGLTKESDEEHVFGLLLAAEEGSEISYCYVPGGTEYKLVGVCDNEIYQFERATTYEELRANTKGESFDIALAVRLSEGSYFVAKYISDITHTISGYVSSSEMVGDKEVLDVEDKIEWEMESHLYPGDETDKFNFHDDDWNFLRCDSEGVLQTVYNPSYCNDWRIEEVSASKGFGGFMITNWNYEYSLALHKLDEDSYEIIAANFESYKDDPAYNFVFDIFVGREYEYEGQPNLYGCGTFSEAVCPYTYSNPKGGNIVTLLNPEEYEMVTSGETTLVDALNNWALVNFASHGFTGYAGVDWARFGSDLNDDYPVHCYYEPYNVKYGDAALPTAKVVSTPDKTNGFPFRYYSHVGDALAYYNAQANGGIMGIYGSDDMSGAAVQSNDADVDVYVNPISYLSCPRG